MRSITSRNFCTPASSDTSSDFGAVGGAVGIPGLNPFANMFRFIFSTWPSVLITPKIARMKIGGFGNPSIGNRDHSAKW
jgi:hypothetical protein